MKDDSSLLGLRLQPERAADSPAVEALIARAFGPGRFAKAAERLREGRRPFLDLCIVARAGGEVVGAVRQWPIAIGAAPAILLGPIAVEAEWRSRGLGARLVGAACAASAAAGHARVLLVGDEAFFAPLGFTALPARRARLPGPVDQNRVLIAALAPGGADALAGPVRAIEGGPAADAPPGLAELEPNRARAYL